METQSKVGNQRLDIEHLDDELIEAQQQLDDLAAQVLTAQTEKTNLEADLLT